MNTRNPLLISGVLAALAIPLLVSAAAASHQCSQLWDDDLRLTCYDKAFGKPVPPPAESAAAAAPAAVASVVAAAPPAAASAAAPAIAATAIAPAAAVVAPAAAPAAVPAPAKVKESDSVTTTVTALSYTLDGRFRATLENGEVWQQLELHPRIPLKSGDRVTLRKAALGSHQLVLPSGQSAKVTPLR
jgi:hypothetical protein